MSDVCVVYVVCDRCAVRVDVLRGSCPVSCVCVMGDVSCVCLVYLLCGLCDMCDVFVFFDVCARCVICLMLVSCVLRAVCE